jgi:hypothetical protein
MVGVTVTTAERVCAQCGGPLASTNPRAQLCSAACRQRARRERARTGEPSAHAPAASVVERPRAASGSDDARLERSVRIELEAVERVDTYLGQSALALARQVDAGRDAGSVVTSLIRELRNTMAAAMVGAATKDSRIDELKERRRARIAGR